MNCKVCGHPMKFHGYLPSRLDDECLDYYECCKCKYIEYLDEDSIKATIRARKIRESMYKLGEL